jgi:hypothetical protein
MDGRIIPIGSISKPEISIGAAGVNVGPVVCGRSAAAVNSTRVSQLSMGYLPEEIPHNEIKEEVVATFS